MITFMAPYPAYEKILFMPHPEMRNKEKPESRIKIHTAMSGELHTYITQNQATKMHYEMTFELTRMKSLELLDFIQLYSAEKWRIEFDALVIICNLLVNPFQIQTLKRSVVANSLEGTIITLEFET